MGKCILLDDAISTLIGLLPRLGMTFEDITGMVVAAVGDQSLTSCIKKRSLVGSAPGYVPGMPGYRGRCLAVRATLTARTEVSCLPHTKRLCATWKLMSN